jgi:hypothetical protein
MIINHLASLGFSQRASFYKNPSNARLSGLSSQLSHWNIERIAMKTATGQSQELAIEDVNFLKEMIHTAINNTSVKCSEVISDQILFLAIGAVQVQFQTGSDKAWKLVNQSIQSFLNAQKEKRIFLIGLVTTVFVICLSAMAIYNTQLRHVNNMSSNSPIASTEGATDPVTMSTLLLAYNKMKSGTCQLPQAAMLPPEQRQAFLLFVNNGTIEVQHVENLRLALGYVNCLYPQELMHPIASAGNSL